MMKRKKIIIAGLITILMTTGITVSAYAGGITPPPMPIAFGALRLDPPPEDDGSENDGTSENGEE